MVIIDTDILIDAGRGLADAVACLQDIEKRFQVIKLAEPISDTAVDLLHRYRLSHGLLIADSLIAATALSLNEPFVTKNQGDYRFITGLQLLPYPRPFVVTP
ncbi:hypothetical protein TFLX_00889 [Thermoflexales bacterium]|nr:hypothetical protein TFLX_00889 [Thermoflexales bacterium]